MSEGQKTTEHDLLVFEFRMPNHQREAFERALTRLAEEYKINAQCVRMKVHPTARELDFQHTPR